MLIKIRFVLTVFLINLENVIITRVHFNTLLEGAYNRMYVFFLQCLQIEGPIVGAGGGQ